jgi:RNA polymerase sigma-70 factor (ECF subfamily)
MVSDSRSASEEVYRKRQISEKVAYATSQLPSSSGDDFRLRNVDGLSIRETAQVLGVPMGTAEARLARARRRLRRIIQMSFRERIKLQTVTSAHR